MKQYEQRMIKENKTFIVMQESIVITFISEQYNRLMFLNNS